MARPSSRASQPVSDLDESTYDMLSDSMTDDDALTTDSLASDRGSEFGEDDLTQASASQYGVDSDDDTTEDEGEDRDSDSYLMQSNSQSMASTLTQQKALAAMASVAADNVHGSDEAMEKMLNSELGTLTGRRDRGDGNAGATEPSNRKSEKKPDSTAFRTLWGMNYNQWLIVASSLALVSSMIIAMCSRFFPPSTSPKIILPKEYGDYLRSNLPSSASSFCSSSASRSTAHASQAAISAYLESLVQKDQHSTKVYSESKKHPARPSPIIVDKEMRPDPRHDDRYRPQSSNIPRKFKESSEEKKTFKSPKSYIFLNSGCILPENVGRKEQSGDRLGPYRELKGSEAKFAASFDTNTNSFQIFTSRPYRGSLAILVMPENCKLLLRGHQPPTSGAKIEWVPAHVPASSLDGKTFSVAIVVPAEASFQVTNVHIELPPSPWTALALRHWTGAMTRYVEPFHSHMQHRAEEIDKLISAVEDSLEQSVVRAHDSAADIVATLHVKATEAALQGRNAIGDALLNVAKQRKLVLGETKKALAKAQRRVKQATGALQLRFERMDVMQRPRGWGNQRMPARMGRYRWV